MTNSYQKGDQWEIEVKGYLEADGYTVHRQHRKALFIAPGRVRMVGADIFGVDLIAKRPGDKTLWVQVSSLANKSGKLKQVMFQPWTYEHDQVQVWLRHKGKKMYSIFELPDGGLVGEVDLGKAKKRAQAESEGSGEVS